MIKTRCFILAAIAAFGAMAYANSAQEHRVCDGVSSYAMCQISLQAWGDETRAHNAGNGIYP